MVMVTLETCVKAGGVTSVKGEYVTVTVKLSDAVFPASSYAVQVTVVVPTGKKPPEE